MKIPLTPTGIELATFRFAAQHTFWGKNHNNIKIFTVQKYVYEELCLIRRKCLHVEIFFKNGNFSFHSEITFSQLLYVVNKKHLFTKNLEIHNNDVRSANNFHRPFTNLTKYQTAARYKGFKMFKHLPTR